MRPRIEGEAESLLISMLDDYKSDKGVVCSPTEYLTMLIHHYHENVITHPSGERMTNGTIKESTNFSRK